MIDLIIFDCDGTLVDSELLCSIAMENEFKKYDIPYPADEMLHKYRGVKLNKIMDIMAAQNGVTLNDDFEHNYRASLVNLFETQLKACKGVQETIPQLQIPTCVASSGPVKKMQLSLSLTGLLPYFKDRLFSSYDIGKWKPDPTIFLHAAEQCGRLPAHCLVVEDSEVGVEAAKSAGMTSVLYDHHDDRNIGLADYKITNMDQLPNLIEQINRQPL